MARLKTSHPLHPLVCISSAVAALVLGLMYAKHPLLPAFIAAMLLIYAAFGLARAALKCLAIFIPISAVFALFSFAFVRNIETAAQMAGRVILIGVSALPMVTLPPINLTRALAELGFPRILTLGMLVAIRFVPVVAAEVRRVREAVRTRGVRKSLVRAFVVPVMIRLMNISDTMALSLETRAFSTGREPVSVYKPVRFSKRDGLYSAATAALLIAWMVAV